MGKMMVLNLNEKYHIMCLEILRKQRKSIIISSRYHVVKSKNSKFVCNMWTLLILLAVSKILEQIGVIQYTE